MDKPQIKTILSSPQPITATTKVAHISSGNSISLSCLVDHANPTPSFVWFRDNKIIKTDTDNVLELHHATLKDTGEYTCLATNGFINKSTSISLHVHCKKTNVSIINLLEPLKLKLILIFLEKTKCYTLDHGLRNT